MVCAGIHSLCWQAKSLAESRQVPLRACRGWHPAAASEPGPKFWSVWCGCPVPWQVQNLEESEKGELHKLIELKEEQGSALRPFPSIYPAATLLPLPP